MRALRLLIASGIVASTLHFADNALEIEHYTEPSWFTPLGVAVTWIPVTALAVIALLQRRANAVFFACAAIYALLLLGGLLHYAFGPPMDMPLRSNATVWLEALIGVALTAALIARRQIQLRR